MVVTKVFQHEVSPSGVYFFDTNVWLYIFGPMAGSKKGKQIAYSQLLRDIISRKAAVYVSSLVLSEYINAVLHIGFSNGKGQPVMRMPIISMISDLLQHIWIL